MASKAVLEVAKDFVSFVNKGPSPFHVVEECKRRLLASGFSELSEKDHWSLKHGGKYFVTNNFSTILVFAVGKKYQSGNGFSMVGAHTDSPCFKVKPRSQVTKQGYIGVGIQSYGGGIWHTWFDKDLKLAGRVVLKTENGLKHKLVHVDRPVLKIPNLCIHLDRDMNKSFSFNMETRTVPILATSIQEKLEGLCPVEDRKCQAASHAPVLVKLLCDELGCSPSSILEFELCLADHQPATIGGAFNEFVFGPRLDNLVNCYSGLEGMIQSLEGDSLEKETNIRLLALFDNEEVGSTSAQGANSSLLENTLRRICGSLDKDYTCAFEEAMSKSLLISADQAHAIHPNYSEKHENNHQPRMHEGPVLKYNANQRYATTAITAAMLREVASKCKVPLQEVAVRNDSSCGSTIGPMLSAKLGLRTVDIGTPQLSMHSIRETSCTSGIPQALCLYREFFTSFPSIDASFSHE